MSDPNQISSYASRMIPRIADDNSDDDLLAELENEIESGSSLMGLRERRLEELQSEMKKIQEMKDNHYGQYTEIVDEKEAIRTSAREPRCVIHFYHKDFKRCKIMDQHFTTLAPRYFSTRFIRVFVENVPWLVEKLGIKVLPCVMCFVGGVAKDRLVGFEELGNQDSFDTAVLEMRLKMSGVIEKPPPVTYSVGSSSYDSADASRKKTIRQSKQDSDGDDD